MLEVLVSNDVPAAGTSKWMVERRAFPFLDDFLSGANMLVLGSAYLLTIFADDLRIIVHFSTHLVCKYMQYTCGFPKMVVPPNHPF